MYSKKNSLVYQIYAGIIFIFFSCNANSQGAYANDTDLKAAYCLPYVNDGEQRLKKITGKNSNSIYVLKKLKFNKNIHVF
jgi:hypothetical protein